MDLRVCSHGVPLEFGPCKHCQEVAELRAEVKRLTDERGRMQRTLEKLGCGVVSEYCGEWPDCDGCPCKTGKAVRP